MHIATERFWRCYYKLPKDIQKSADKCFKLLKENPGHPSLHFKKIGNFWSVRIDLSFRALAVEHSNDIIWVWIGTHDDYEQMLKQR